MRSAALKSSDFLSPDDDFILTEFAFEPFTQSRQKASSISSAMISITAMPSRSVSPPLWATDKTGRAAKLFSQLFQEAVKPLLPDRLAASGLLWEEYLNEERRP
jgi:hypothetical protein